MPKRSTKTITTSSPPTLATSRTFGGGLVLCRRTEGSFSSADPTHRSTTVLLSQGGFFVLKLNVSIWCAGEWRTPDYYTADFTAQYTINNGILESPSARISRSFGEVPFDYGYNQTSQNSIGSALWGPNLPVFPTSLNLHLSGIVSLSGNATVGVYLQNNSVGLSGRIRYDINITAISVAAEPDQQTIGISQA